MNDPTEVSAITQRCAGVIGPGLRRGWLRLPFLARLSSSGRRQR